MSQPKVVRDPRGGDVHAALVEDLVDGQLGRRVLAEVERHAPGHQPVVDGARLGLGDLAVAA